MGDQGVGGSSILPPTLLADIVSQLPFSVHRFINSINIRLLDTTTAIAPILSACTVCITNL